MGDCQNYDPFLGPDYNTGPNTGPNLGDPKRDHNFDNLPYVDVNFRWNFHDSHPLSFQFQNLESLNYPQPVILPYMPCIYIYIYINVYTCRCMCIHICYIWICEHLSKPF